MEKWIQASVPSISSPIKVEHLKEKKNLFFGDLGYQYELKLF